MDDEQSMAFDQPLVPDPDADQEMGSGDAAAIADEDLKGSRLLIVRRAAEAIDLDGIAGGAVQFACTFQPAQQTRFTWARLLLRLTTPQGIRIVDVAPRDAPGEPVKLTVDRKGKLGFSKFIDVSAEASVHKEFAVYHCAVQGSGESTAIARWDFTEDPQRQDGLGREQVLALTLPVSGTVTATVSVSARLARAGLRGQIEAIRDLVLGARTNDKQYQISFEIPPVQPRGGLARFLHLG